MNTVIIQEITSQQLADLLKAEPRDLFLLDVREKNEVEICTIKGSVHIPMNLIPLYLDQIPDDKKIIIYCHHGIRSLNVAHYLLSAGFDEDSIYNLKGGIDNWATTCDSTMIRY